MKRLLLLSGIFMLGWSLTAQEYVKMPKQLKDISASDMKSFILQHLKVILLFVCILTLLFQL